MIQLDRSKIAVILAFCLATTGLITLAYAQTHENNYNFYSTTHYHHYPVHHFYPEGFYMHHSYTGERYFNHPYYPIEHGYPGKRMEPPPEYSD